MPDCFYITTPIYYVNDLPHIGHSYATICSDVMARFKRQCGYKVLFSTGTDEHGQKVEQAAKENNKSPQVYVDNIVPRWKKLWSLLSITNTDFIRTTDERHILIVQDFFKTLHEKGDIYKGEYSGWYCTPCESFWLKSQLENGNCPNPECRRPVSWIKEESYFFRLSKYQDKLLSYIEDNPDFICPESRYNEVTSFIKGGLQDTCISRTTFSWGIPVPFDSEHIVYVWLDALINYLTVAGYLKDTDMFNEFWPPDVHLIGKDILRFHAILWPALLMSADLPLPKRIFATGFWTMEGEKMSKSKGNVIQPEVLINELKEELSIDSDLAVDVLRYYLLRDVHMGLDGDFSKKSLILRFNSDLANDLGNLIHRTVPMLEKYFQGKVPESNVVVRFTCPPHSYGGRVAQESNDAEIKNLAKDLCITVEKYYNNLQFSDALTEVWKFIARCNKYIDNTAPWRLAEKNDGRLNTVIYNILESIRIIAYLVSPAMPVTSNSIWRQLGIKEEIDKKLWDEACRWGGLIPDTQIVKEKPLFPRKVI